MVGGEGNLAVRFQGKSLDRRHQEARTHVPYLACLPTCVAHRQYLWGFVSRDAENPSASSMTFGVVFQQLGWHVILLTRKHGGRRFLDAALALPPHVFHIGHVVTARACKGVVTMLALTQRRDAEVFM